MKNKSNLKLNFKFLIKIPKRVGRSNLPTLNFCGEVDIEMTKELKYSQKCVIINSPISKSLSAEARGQLYECYFTFVLVNA